jgi:hypothetical protein
MKRSRSFLPRVLASQQNLYDLYGVTGELLAILVAAVLSVVLTVVIIFRRIRLRHRKLRAFVPCHRCGFDLRATTGPCPQCGAKRRDPPPADPPRTTTSDLFDDFEDEPWHVS